MLLNSGHIGTICLACAKFPRFPEANHMFKIFYYLHKYYLHKCLGQWELLLTFRQVWDLSTTLESQRLQTKSNAVGRTFQGQLACQLLSMQLSSLLLVLLMLKAAQLVSKQNLRLIATPSCSTLLCTNKCFFHTVEDLIVDEFMSKYLCYSIWKCKKSYEHDYLCKISTLEKIIQNYTSELWNYTYFPVYNFLCPSVFKCK